MKTKILLGALAMPMFFAACSNEELMESPANANLQNRIPLGEVTLNFDGTNSRLALKDGSFNALDWTDGDDLGASLIDVVGTLNPEAETLVEKIAQYNLTKTPQTNYRYEYNNGGWSSKAAMVEGNYVFYMPYAENTNRVAPLAVLPIEQTLEQVTVNGETAYTTYNSVLENAKENGNIMAVAYKFLSAEGENGDGNKSISISFKQMYATPLISIQNYARNEENQLTDLTINKIILSKEDEATFTVKEYLNFTNTIGTATAEAWSAGNASIVKSLNTVLDEDDDDYKGGTWAQGKNEVKKSTSDLLGTAYNEADGESKTITINIEEPITIASTETFAFYATIPGGDYEAKNLKVTLVTTDNKQVDVVMPDAHFNPGKRYAVQGYDAEGNVDAGATAFLAVTTKQLEAYVPVVTPGVEIATQAELYAAIATAKKVDLTDNGVDDPTPVNLIFIPAEGVVLNNQVINMLNDKKAEIASVTFNGDLAISGLTATTTIPVTINGKATMSNTVNATIAAAGVANVVGITGAITVAEGAEVQLSGAAASTITNNGTLTIGAATTVGGNVTNNSVLNLEGDLTAAAKNLTNAEGATINVVSYAVATFTKVINKGTINVNGDDFEINAVTENQGVITAAMIFDVSGKFTNKKDAELNVTAGTTSFTGEFVNNGAVQVSYGATLTATANGTNKSTIDNAGTLNIKYNVGTINVTNNKKFGNCVTNVTNQSVDATTGKTVWGNIYNPNGKTISSAALTTAGQYVWQSADAVTGEVAFAGTDETYNAVKFNDAEVTASALTGLIYAEFNGTSKLNASADLTIANVTVVGGELELMGVNTITITEFIVNEGAVVGWESALTLAGSIYNYGEMYFNAGTVTATCYNAGGEYFGTETWPGLQPMP